MKTEDDDAGANDDGEEEPMEWRPAADKALRRVKSGGFHLKRQMNTSTLVTLHIYDLNHNVAVAGLNKVFHSLGTGVFHAGVEVYGTEYSYGYVPDPDATGVFSNPPMECQLHSYRESHIMGHTDLGEGTVDQLIEEMEKTWRGDEYDLLKHNCTNFSEELCTKLHVGSIPAWVRNLAAAGATIKGGFTFLPNAASNAASDYAVIAAAKAGEFDAAYGITSTTTAGAKEVLGKVGSGIQVGIDSLGQIIGRDSKNSKNSGVTPVAPPAGETVAQAPENKKDAKTDEVTDEKPPANSSAPKQGCCVIS